MKVKRTSMFFLSIALPWLVLLINDDPVGAFIAIIMQVTVIGWIPASIWAWNSVKKAEKNKTPTPKSDSRDIQ